MAAPDLMLTRMPDARSSAAVSSAYVSSCSVSATNRRQTWTGASHSGNAPVHTHHTYAESAMHHVTGMLRPRVLVETT